MSKHTPEPWVVRRSGGTDCLFSETERKAVPIARMCSHPDEFYRNNTRPDGNGGTITTFLPSTIDGENRVNECVAEREASAARIVSCVNAMAGIDDPEGFVRDMRELRGALQFIMAFYEPGQRYLDTEAWKQAEAGGYRTLEKTKYLVDAALLSRMEAKT